MPKQTQSRFRKKEIITLLVAIVFLNAYIIWQSPFAPSIETRQSRLWDQLHPLLEKHAPDCPSPQLVGTAGTPRYDATYETPRRNFISNSESIEWPMQRAHDRFVQDIISEPLDRPYARTKGIVSAAGGPYLPTFVVALRMLRRTGSKLPVELFVKDWVEYEPYICEVVLPQLNAKCVVLSELIPLGDRGRKIDHFQIKSFAMLFSSFESLIWMDSDIILLHNPERLLRADPFTSTGLVTWPDFWSNTASPVYFNISRQSSSTKRQATEAGMILLSKKTHFRSLLLATYYNYYGPSHYYRLLGQGAPGEGDKDTFIHAASALGEDFYTVSEPVVDLGHLERYGKGIIGAAMLQSDPIEDYALTKKGKWRVKDSSVAKAPRAFFIHANTPKMNPAEELLGEKAQNPDGSPSRLWTDSKEALQRLGHDAEKATWTEVKVVSCTLEHAFDTWKRKTDLCRDVERHWNALFGEQAAEAPKFTDD